jgi:hypothetical protein
VQGTFNHHQVTNCLHTPLLTIWLIACLQLIHQADSLSLQVLGNPLPKLSTHPVRGANNEAWVAGTFRHLSPETAELKRSILRSFIASVTWWNHEPSTRPILDNFVVATPNSGTRCGFCDRRSTAALEAIQCVKAHLDYHPHKKVLNSEATLSTQTWRLEAQERVVEKVHFWYRDMAARAEERKGGPTVSNTGHSYHVKLVALNLELVETSMSITTPLSLVDS